MSEIDESGEVARHYRVRRGAAQLFGSLGTAWREKRWFRWLGWALLAAVLVWLAGWAFLTRGLPDAESLLDYEPNLPSVVRGIDGEIVHRYERERRVALQFKDLPPQLMNAYTSAEDKTFWSHNGIDATGFANAVFDYVSKLGSGERAVGGSTITQQVAKNILVGDEYSVTRKLKEMILATRIEGVLSKREIITLYLNEIPLGRRSFGVQAAARAYFNKDVGDLDLHEMAFLAILPKAPERYGRAGEESAALERRNFVLEQMVENGHITAAQSNTATRMPLGLVNQTTAEREADAGYFLEEVRRVLLERYGEQAENGRNSVYAGGLWVRTSLDQDMQDAARNSLRRALLSYHGTRGWTGPIATLNSGDGDLTSQLASAYISINYEDWRIGVVTERSGASAKVGFAGGDEAPLTGMPDAVKTGDVLAVSPSGNGWRVRTIPEVSGGFVAMSPTTGRVFAMQGGFDSRLSDFNRATQALRQPGSTIKPFVYATGLDHGMTPATMVPDRQYCYYQGANLGEKCFTNFGGSRGGGEYPMRYGLEQSKNLMTVHIAMDSGMENVIRTFERAGIEPTPDAYDPYPAFALGAGDTTVLRMVNAYAMLVNHGRLNEPTLIDYVQDRDGKVIWRADERECTACNMAQWDGTAMPRFGRRGAQAMDGRTAYQTVHMLEGVVERGTATRLLALDMPLFGKTGTSTGPTNAWFVGGGPDIVAGTYIGFDQQSRSLGGWVQGGNTAVPIFLQFARETRDRWSGRPFLAPEGVRMVRVDRRTGNRVLAGWPTGGKDESVIWEAFKPDTEPKRAKRNTDEIAAIRELILSQLRRREAGPRRAVAPSGEAEQADVAEEEGGIY